MVERKPLLAKPKHHIVCPNEKNMILVLNHKKSKDYYEYPSFLILRMSCILRKMVERKAFLPNQCINIVYPNKGNKITVLNHKKNEHCY